MAEETNNTTEETVIFAADMLEEDEYLKKMKEESEELLALRFMTAENCSFARTPGGFVSLTFQDKTYERVNVYRTFPLTEPERYISIREPDEKAKEIGVVKDLTDLSNEQADILREQMKLRYFMPIIERIYDVKDEFGYAYFHVGTNFGEFRFTIWMNASSVVTLSEKRLMITDLDGNRYDIPDTEKLTAKEMRKLDIFI